MRFRLMNLFLLITLLMASTASAQWRLDGSDQLRNFRIDDQLNASASAQPSDFDALIKKLPRGFTFYMVDLRQESHGFANGVPISWYEQYNRANAGMVAGADVERDELKRLQSIVGTRQTFTPLGNSDKKLFKPLKVKVKDVGTERDAATQAGFNYVRFAAADMSAPDEHVINEFVRFVKQLPPDAWLHFHCQAGMGRTTFFMVIYDIIRNPDKSLEEIMTRQVELGGSDLLAEDDGDDWYAQHHRERAAMLRDFYKRLRINAVPPFDMPLASIDQPFEAVTIPGQSQASQQQMIRLINHRNPNPKLTCSVEEIVAAYYDEASREGIRADLALCQALKETGFFAYGGDVDPAQNNYCGLGATGNHVKGASFDSPRLGARAHIQHLLAYCSTRRPTVDVIDPRYEIVMSVRRNKINNWVGLGGTWAVPGVYYGQDIINLWKQALAIGHEAKSIEECTRAIELKPCFENYYNRALMYERSSDYEQAIADYTSSLELEPMFPQAWYNRGRAYWLNGRYDEATADFNHVLKFVPQFARQLEAIL